MEGLCEKYGDEVNLDRQNWIILKNKKYLGALQRHHIQQVNNLPRNRRGLHVFVFLYNPII